MICLGSVGGHNSRLLCPPTLPRQIMQIMPDMLAVSCNKLAIIVTFTVLVLWTLAMANKKNVQQNDLHTACYTLCLKKVPTF